MASHLRVIHDTADECGIVLQACMAEKSGVANYFSFYSLVLPYKLLLQLRYTNEDAVTVIHIISCDTLRAFVVMMMFVHEKRSEEMGDE